MSKRLNAAVKVYQALLRLYPPAFRQEYGEPMLQVFRDGCREAEKRGGMVRFWLAALVDLLRNAAAERAKQMLTRRWLIKALYSGGTGAAYLVSWFVLAFTVMLITYFMLIPWDEGVKPSGTFAAAVNNLVEGSHLVFVPSMIVTVCEVIAMARLTRRHIYSAARIWLHFFLLNTAVFVISAPVAQLSVIVIERIFPQPAPFVINPGFGETAVYSGLLILGAIIAFFVRLARSPAHLPLTRLPQSSRG